MTNRLHVGDEGTKLVLDIDPLNENNITPSVVSSAKMLITKPDGTILERNASVEGHTVVYYTIAGDLDIEGLYCLQAEVTLASGWSGKSDIVQDYIYP